MFVTKIATRNPRMFRMVHIWVRVQQTKVYEGISEAIPNVI